MAQVLIRLGADPNRSTDTGINHLHMASLPGGSPEVVSILINGEADPARTNENGYTALHVATSQSELWPKNAQTENLVAQTVDILIQAGTEVDARLKENGHTALHQAIVAGYTGAAQALLEANADPLFETAEGEAAQAMAERYGREDILPLIQQSMDRRLLAAAESGPVEDVRALLVAGADPGTTDSDGRTPLDLAEAHGQKEAATMLRNI